MELALQKRVTPVLRNKKIRLVAVVVKTSIKRLKFDRDNGNSKRKYNVPNMAAVNRLCKGSYSVPRQSSRRKQEGRGSQINWAKRRIVLGREKKKILEIKTLAV